MGKKVYAMALQDSCVLFTLHRGLAELAPTAGTDLEAGDRLTVVITPQAAAWCILRQGGDVPHASPP